MCESTSSQRFRLLAQDMMEHCFAATVTVSNTVDTELIADCKTYSENSGLKFWVTNANEYPLLAPLAQDLLSAPASEAYLERVFSVCGELSADSRQEKSADQKPWEKNHAENEPEIICIIQHDSLLKAFS